MNNLYIPGSFGGDIKKLNDDSKLECKICWYVYDPESGDDYWHIPPSTPFSALPEHWTCPECDGNKIDFMVLNESLS